MAAHGTGLPATLASLPAPVYVLFAVLTQLGDVWFVVALATLVYWLGEAAPLRFDRRRAAFVLGVALCAVAVVPLLKHLLALPRPPGAGPPARGVEVVPPALRPLYTSMATGDGYGVPSGHAFGSTAVYGAIAWSLPAYARRRRVLVVAAVVATVSVSRLVLGVHHLLDVVVGVLGGLALLLGARWLSTGGERPGRLVSLSVAFAAGNVLVAGVGPESFAILGATVGAALGWLATARPPAPSVSRRVAWGAVLVGCVLVAAVFGVPYLLSANPGVRFLAAALALALVVAWPGLVGRVAGPTA
ncbi:MAG: phosphatase PAP2 family protein [Haloarculaceae archaeon]